MFCFTKLPFYISSFEEKKNNTLVVSLGYLWSVTVTHFYFLFVFIIKRESRCTRKSEGCTRTNRMEKYNNTSATADFDPPDPNPLADMNPSSQIWTPPPNFHIKRRLYQIW